MGTMCQEQVMLRGEDGHCDEHTGSAADTINLRSSLLTVDTAWQKRC